MGRSSANAQVSLVRAATASDEADVYLELCEIVDEWIDLLKRDGKPLPPPTAGRGVAALIG